MDKQLPRLTTDDEAERFVDAANLSDYDLSAFQPVSLEFAKKSKQQSRSSAEGQRSAKP